ncbi:PREDICTED: tumor necrosis factor receptor superfamily member 13C [Colobus angolensis palliatus]|uniref:tumor necrosis factor receptor superfamily member 13C n=1 Tax=Colobus angolensis palliatus TaxID=336983 RepID=UPI0005F554ED|nr:PREDICTED: tumor necrosis factor receptor superfamily member 13C [Colobus angolensis palliatus]
MGGQRVGLLRAIWRPSDIVQETVWLREVMEDQCVPELVLGDRTFLAKRGSAARAPCLLHPGSCEARRETEEPDSLPALSPSTDSGSVQAGRLYGAVDRGLLRAAPGGEWVGTSQSPRPAQEAAFPGPPSSIKGDASCAWSPCELARPKGSPSPPPPVFPEHMFRYYCIIITKTDFESALTFPTPVPEACRAHTTLHTTQGLLQPPPHLAGPSGSPKLETWGQPCSPHSMASRCIIPCPGPPVLDVGHRLLFGAPALLGLALVLALVLVGLVSWRRRQRRLRGASFAEAPDGDKDKDEPLDKVIILSPGISDAAAPAWPPPGEDPGTTPPGHSVPVPATELGSTELVTTKTAGPEQQ